MNHRGFLSQNYTYALIGASGDPEKYGYKILKDLDEGGYQVKPVNPKGGEIAGHQVYTDLSELSNEVDEIDVVVFVVPPSISLKVLEEVVALGIKKVWFQPGSYNEQVKKICSQHDLLASFESCIMVVRRTMA